MMLVKTYVAPSGIEGVGVYAAEPLKAGQEIWRFDADFDRLVSQEKLDSYPPSIRDFLTKYSYPHHQMAGYYVLESDNGRFMNHSEQPNTDFTGQDVGYALVDIPAGVELTSNYAEFDATFDLLPSDVARYAARSNGHDHHSR